MKLRVQTQHLQPGDIVGSGERIINTVINSINVPKGKVHIWLQGEEFKRTVLWGKYTMINVERPEKIKSEDVNICWE